MNLRPAPTVVIQDDHTIIVKGYCASGKSTLAHIIAIALNEYGINSLIVDDEDGKNVTNHLDKRIEALKAKGTITIEAVQLNRACF